MRLRGISWIVALAMVALVAGGPAGARESGPVAGAAGIGDPYYPLDGNGGIDVLHYDIHDNYAFDSFQLSGMTTLRIRATEALSSFHLDFLLPVWSASVDGTAAKVRRPSRHEVVIRPASPIAKGHVFTVKVAYGGTPTMQSYAGESNWAADRQEVVAMNEPHMAPWWFPSNDHPADKARYDVSITTRSDRQVIGNGEQVSRTVSGSNATTHWRMRQPMATYLAFFAAGSYYVYRGTSRAGIPWVVAVSKRFHGRTLAKYRRILRRTGAITDWLQKELGRYPFSSTGGVATHLPVGFALENQSRPTFPWVDHTTVVHELAHQWFGDSVSLHRWRDVWLNEGFAEYMEERWREAHGGRTTRQWLQHEYAGFAGDGRFWRLPIGAPGARHLFDDPIYDRGAMTLAALKVRIGAHDFRHLLRSWAARHRYGNGTTKQFEALAHRISGERLGGFFKAWLMTRHAPRRTSANGL